MIKVGDKVKTFCLRGMKSYNIINVFVLIFVLFLFIGCISIRYGSKPSKLDDNIEYIAGEYITKENNIKVKYVISEQNNDNKNLVFYFHGIGRSEYEWIEEDGFGRMFYDVIKNNDNFKPITVVSISLGGAYLFVEDAPEPYNDDLETLFVDEIVPCFKRKLSKNGNVYLIGHSMGGFNALVLSFRNPDVFKTVTAISPFVAPISPFTEEFEKRGKELKMTSLQIAIIKKMLTTAFPNEEKWHEYNPFSLVKNYNKTERPYVFLSSATEDLPGFSESIEEFSKILDKNKFSHKYCKSKGDHKSVCYNLFYSFLNHINNK